MTKILREITRFFLYLVAPEKESVRKLSYEEPRELARILPAAKPIAYLRDGAQNLFALFAYKDRRVKEIVWEIKYRKNSALAEKIGFLLFEKMKARIRARAENFNGNPPEIILAPIPTSSARRKERGFNQCEVICEAVMKNAPPASEIFSYEPYLLAKIKNTPHQADLTRKERLTNVAGSFAIPHPEKVCGKIIFIVDDVITTGRTIGEAEAMLMEAGAKSVYGFAIAH
ncbi:MAG: hypothetical protein AAB726_02310 [Patescibacteria group bacterium]